MSWQQTYDLYWERGINSWKYIDKETGFYWTIEDRLASNYACEQMFFAALKEHKEEKERLKQQVTGSMPILNITPSSGFGITTIGSFGDGSSGAATITNCVSVGTFSPGDIITISSGGTVTPVEVKQPVNNNKRLLAARRKKNGT